MDHKVFEVTENHLKLLDHIYIGYNEWTEFGAPEVDPKRPYGNSDVYGDIGEILDIEPESDAGYGEKEYSESQRESMLTIHKEMQHVLQILVLSRTISPGRYRTSSSYGNDWKRED